MAMCHGQVPADDFGELRRELVVVGRAARQPGDKPPQGSLGAGGRHRAGGEYLFSGGARRLVISRLREGRGLQKQPEHNCSDQDHDGHSEDC